MGLLMYGYLLTDDMNERFRPRYIVMPCLHNLYDANLSGIDGHFAAIRPMHYNQTQCSAYCAVDC